jgi:hypothetical protein
VGEALRFAVAASEVECFEMDEAWLTALDFLVFRQRFSSVSLVGPVFLVLNHLQFRLYQLKIERIGRACYAWYGDQL